jgi:hypothetical protein
VGVDFHYVPPGENQKHGSWNSLDGPVLDKVFTKLAKHLDGLYKLAADNPVVDNRRRCWALLDEIFEIVHHPFPPGWEDLEKPAKDALGDAKVEELRELVAELKLLFRVSYNGDGDVTPYFHAVFEHLVDDFDEWRELLYVMCCSTGEKAHHQQTRACVYSLQNHECFFLLECFCLVSAEPRECVSPELQSQECIFLLESRKCVSPQTRHASI